MDSVRVVTASGWTAGPRRPHLASGEIHVWLADLATVDADLRLLSPAERGRALRIIRAPARDRWVRSRALLRDLLGRYLGVDAEEVDLAVDGRPRGPELSVSHSLDLALYAVAKSRTVGVDIEAHRAELRASALAHRLAAAGEPVGPKTPGAELLARWTQREALFKTAIPRAWVRPLDIGERGVAAVAANEAPTRLRLWTLGPVAARAALAATRNVAGAQRAPTK